MSPERYRQINALAEAALSMSASARQDFLERACGSDEDLRHRVAELMRSYESSEGFLERPAFEAWARDMAASNEEKTLAGRQVGRYLVVSHLGSGGIGEVWLARDSELGREVALKLLSPELADDPDHVRRFQQEARAASSLNHPNLVTVYDIGEFETRRFIAQEYVPGKTVRDTLATGPMPVDSAVDMAAQVAAALSAAHGAAIIHRDIKPENIMIRPDGLVKVLDFGLARLLERGSPGAAQKGDSGLTRPGFIIGTARYMSPEQARGTPVDGRSDIFNLGVVMYEALTGKAPFSGPTPSDVLAAILARQPIPISQCAPPIPEALAKAVHRCLEKDPELRFQSAADLRGALLSLDNSTIEIPATKRRRAPWYAIAASVLVVAGIASYFLWGSPRGGTGTDGRVLRYSLSLPAGQQLDALQISPAGDQIVYSARQDGKSMIFRRFLDEEESRPVAGGEGGEQPFFSPDGKEIGFYTPHSLRVVNGAVWKDVAAISAEFYLRRAFWGGGFLYYTSSLPEDGAAEAIWRVPAAGGKPQLVLRSKLMDKGATMYIGQQVSGGRWLLCSSIVSPTRRSIERIDLERLDPVNFPATRMVERGMGGQLLPTGHLLYFWRGRLLAARYDERTGAVAGSPIEVMSGVAANGWFGPNASVSNNGTLVYARRAVPHRRLSWIGHDGKETPVGVPDAAYEDAEISPDGGRLALSRQDSEDRWTLWVVNLGTNAWTQLGETDVPRPRAIWSPDGKSLAASLAKDNSDFVNLYRIPLSAPQDAERLTVQPDFGQFPFSWSAARNAILYVEGTRPGTQSDIFALNLKGRQTRALVTSPSPDGSPTFSRDGKWFAYVSRQQSGADILIQRSDQAEAARKVASGADPLWSSDGKSLYFLGADGSLMHVAISDGGTAGAPKVFAAGLSDLHTNWWGRPYHQAPDGRFLIIRNLDDHAPPRSQIHVVVNWLEELKRSVP